MTMEEALRRKYGMGPEQVAAGHARLTEMGAEVGFDFHFERIQLGNTFDAHRVAQAARGSEQEHAVIAGLFKAYFTDGRLLSDHEVLRDVARSAGLDEVLIDKVLGGDLFAREVRLDESAAQELEVTGVPFFLVDGRWPIPGAQDVETLVTVLTGPGPAPQRSESRIWSTISTVASGWRKAKRATVSPSQLVGVTNPTWSRSRRADHAS